MVGDLIRPLEERDHGAFAEMIREAFVPPADQLGITPENCPVHPSGYTEQWVLSDQAKGRRLFVLEDNGSIVGGVGVLLGDTDEAEMTRLGVRPGLQGKGYGSALVGFAERYARAEGAARMGLHLFAELEPLRRWYEHRGYEYVDTVEIDVVPLPVDVMTKQLGK